MMYWFASSSCLCVTKMHSTLLHKFQQMFVLQLEGQKFHPEVAKIASSKTFGGFGIKTYQFFIQESTKRRVQETLSFFFAKCISRKYIELFVLCPCCPLNKTPDSAIGCLPPFFLSSFSFFLCLYIYIYMAVGVTGAAFLALFFSFFPSFIVKNRVLEMLLWSPILSFFWGTILRNITYFCRNRPFLYEGSSALQKGDLFTPF